MAYGEGELERYTSWLDREDVDWFKSRFGRSWGEILRHLMARERKQKEEIDDAID